jgi:hypothetical protein
MTMVTTSNEQRSHGAPGAVRPLLIQLLQATRRPMPTERLSEEMS